MLEAGMVRAFVRQVTPAKIKSLRDHVAQERRAVADRDVSGRTELLGDFHVRMAKLMGNDVLAELLGDLISRCALIALMYQSEDAAQHSNEQHALIVKALAAKDEALAVQLMNEHLNQVEKNLCFDRAQPVNDLSQALARQPVSGQAPSQDLGQAPATKHGAGRRRNPNHPASTP
jgi:DNA-binding GntR family transcriptional regulator